MAKIRRVCVFCGSAPGFSPVYRQAAEEVGRLIASSGFTLVYGGGRVGLMGIVADACLEAGGQAIGIIPKALYERELGHTGLTELLVVGSMHERKALMSDKADAFLALPGGFGTLEELFEVVTWLQLGVHRKPCGILNLAGYFDPLLALCDRAVGEGFISQHDRNLLLSADEAGALMDKILSFEPPTSTKWMSLVET